jgi:hypothetical protein
MEANIVKVARQGDVPIEIGVTDDMTVEQLLDACDARAEGGYADHAGQIYAKRADGTSQVVSRESLVNGFVAFVLTTAVKGGC